MTDGKIRPSFEVHCGICEKPALGLAFGKTKKDAAQELRKYGWREHMAYGWCCETCGNRSARLNPTPAPREDGKPGEKE